MFLSYQTRCTRLRPWRLSRASTVIILHPRSSSHGRNNEFELRTRPCSSSTVAGRCEVFYTEHHLSQCTNNIMWVDSTLDVELNIRSKSSLTDSSHANYEYVFMVTKS